VAAVREIDDIYQQHDRGRSKRIELGRYTIWDWVEYELTEGDISKANSVREKPLKEVVKYLYFMSQLNQEEEDE